jgi:hypothetical protein
MAIRISNQITFTEQKKVLEIREWYLAVDKNTDITHEAQGWTTEVQMIDEVNRYLWNYEEVIYSIGSSEKSDPVIIGFYGKGSDGKGISDIKNYYLVTQTPELPENPEWSETILMLTPTNKYLWNYDEIIYTDGMSKNSTAAIIGVYGDSGADAVDFQIYSVNGFEFSDSIQSIELKTIAYTNGSKISDTNVGYSWKWWNAESESDDKYEEIANANTSVLIVKVNDPYAFASIKCELSYDGLIYEDYVSLTRTTAIYTAVSRFFDGNNAITADEDYLIIYVELYKDNVPEELLYDKNVYISDNNIVEDGVIATDIDQKECIDGNTMYFVCKVVYGNVIEYDTVFGQYSAGQWNVIASDYIYKNDLFVNTTSPIVFVPKDKISRALTVNFEVRSKTNAMLARTSAMLLDFNDPTVSGAEPVDPQVGQLWLDTSVSPSILKMWDGIEWVNSNYQNGNVVYTSQPKNGYSSGDLWILANGETCGDFGPGSMLKANVTSSTFDQTHWDDAMKENTSIINDVKQYFAFNKNTGLKIGQSNEKFYVNISSTEMGFYDEDQKVVNISNQSATIKSAKLKGNTDFYGQINICDPKSIPEDNTVDNLFIFKIESNGSFSLALAT